MLPIVCLGQVCECANNGDGIVMAQECNRAAVVPREILDYWYRHKGLVGRRRPISRCSYSACNTSDFWYTSGSLYLAFADAVGLKTIDISLKYQCRAHS